jgi:hypothetical protein
MDDATNNNEIRLREGSSIAERLVIAGFAAIVALFFTPGLLANDYLEVIISTFALLLGIVFISGVMLAPAVVWIITPDEILIGQQRPFGRLRTRLVPRDEIEGMQVQRNKTSKTRFHLAFTLVSGERLTSPPISDVTRVHLTVARIAEQFGVPHVEPPVNPLDAANPEMHLGEPAEPVAGRDVRIIMLVIAGLCTIPYAYKLWNGLSPGVIEIILLPAGAIAAFAFYRYAHLLTGAFWMIRQGDIRVERIARGGRLCTDQIEGRDVETITVERRGRSEDEHYVVAIKLRSGRKFRSPRIGPKSAARAVGAEIVRRLGIEPQKVRL